MEHNIETYYKNGIWKCGCKVNTHFISPFCHLTEGGGETERHTDRACIVVNVSFMARLREDPFVCETERE